jgi:hypothetical protein
MRRGWTLHELIISLGVMAGVIALAVQMAVGQLRFFRGIGEIASLDGQLWQAAATAATVMWEASAAGGDIVVALDSAMELRAAIGTAVVCGSSPGRVTIPAPSAVRNTLSAFLSMPDADDAVFALLEDSLGQTWLTFRVASSPSVADGCVSFPSVAPWTFELREQIAIPIGTVLRFARPLRLSLYRASDNRWYLGARDWNVAAQRFNSIQPVAGPLEPYSADPSKTGLRFAYFDAAGAELSEGSDTRRIASVGISARGKSIRPVRIAGMARHAPAYADSVTLIVGLRNAR